MDPGRSIPSSSEAGSSPEEGASSRAARDEAPERQPPPTLETLLEEELGPEIQLLRPLGRGSMSNVYLAREPALKRLVAVKVLHPGLAEDEEARLRFEREGQSAASISHPNVVTIHRVGRLSDDTPYLVMEYVKGRTLAERIAAEGPLPLDEARRILADVASALAAAHRKDVVHRDVKPSNVMYERETGRVVLTDFGLAAILATGEDVPTRITRTGEAPGDPSYMSPERVKGEELTGLADVYSLAILGYELIAGRGPFEARTDMETAVAHLHQRPRPLAELREGVGAELEGVLERCLAKSPRGRPSAEWVADHIRSSRPTLAREDRAASGREGRSGVWPAGAEGGILEQLRHRRIPQIVGAFAAGGWAILELVDQLVQQAILPGLAYELVLVFFIAGFPTSFVLAWFHGARGPQHLRPVEIWILSAIAFVWLAVSSVVAAS